MDLGWLDATLEYLWLDTQSSLCEVDVPFWGSSTLLLPELLSGHLRGRLPLFRRLFICDPRYFHRGACSLCVLLLDYHALPLLGSRYTLDPGLSDVNYLARN